MNPRLLTLIICAVASTAPTLALQPNDATKIFGVPYQISGELELSRVSVDAAMPVLNARSSSASDVRKMLASEDTASRSLGLDAATYQCRPDLLVEAVWLLDDARLALPQLHVDASSGEPFTSPPQPIRSHYRTLLGFWFRDLPPEDEALRDLLQERLDPWDDATAWWLRFQNLAASQRSDELAEAKRDFANAPENVQWIVVTRAQLNPRNRPAFSSAEIKTILDNLSPDTKRKIADRTIELPRDYKHLRNEGNEELLDQLFDRYDALTRSP